VAELQPAVTQGLTIVYVGHVSEAIKVAFRSPQTAKKSAKKTVRKR
jgi:hypothetical protein